MSPTHTHGNVKDGNSLLRIETEMQQRWKQAHDRIRQAQCVLTPLKSFRFQPGLNQISTTHCAEGLLLYNMTWSGLALKTDTFALWEKCVRLCLCSFLSCPWLYQMCLCWTGTKVWHQCPPSTPSNCKTQTRPKPFDGTLSHTNMNAVVSVWEHLKTSATGSVSQKI